MKITRRTKFIATAIVLLVIGLAGFSLATPGPSIKYGAVAGSSTDQLPPAPTDLAPPFAQRVDAIGCAQSAAVTVAAGDGLLIVNTGTIQLKLLPDGMLSIPGWPMAPLSWIHFSIRAAGTYEIDGTRYSCTARGIAAPHFRLTITVT